MRAALPFHPPESLHSGAMSVNAGPKATGVKKQFPSSYFRIRIALLFAVVGVSGLNAAEDDQKGKLYFPPSDGEWETVDPNALGWNTDKLHSALDYAKKNHSTGVVILYRGKILVEQHFKVTGARSAKFRRPRVLTDLGHSIEDVASAQKSVASILVGIAQEKGLLKISDPVSQHLGDGWSRAPLKQERVITIRHLLTMTSGLSARLRYVTPPSAEWKYNTTAYAKTREVVAAAAGMDRNEVTTQWLTGPLKMADSKWVRRKVDDPQSGNNWGFNTSARDLARFGLMVLNDGKWNGKTILGDLDYLRASTRSSQKENPFYGYLWWVNRNAYAPQGGLKTPNAPKDMFQASGALNRRCHIVPSQQLVVTRLGDRPESKGYDNYFWKLLSAAMPKQAK